MREPVLHTDGMAVGYDRKILIQDIELSVARGEILTLIGPNGAGKSTILKSITRRLELIAGTVYVGKSPLSSMSDRQAAQKLSVMLTGRIEPELMTCRDVVESGRIPYTGRFGILSAHDREVVEQTMQTVHVSELADRSFMCISDGQRQRVMLARAICQEPEILILDEPTSYLDIRHKLELLSILKELVNSRGIAVVMSMHELDLAQRISDRVVCVCKNRIDRCGTPEEIFTDEYITRLYDVSCGSFDGAYGTVELARPEGRPRVFVIGGGGDGLSVYRELQRMGIPFAAGILHENDIEHPAARQLASAVVTEQAFEPIADETLERAESIMLGCEAVVCATDSFGTMNRRNGELRELARQRGLLLSPKWQNEIRDRNIP